MINLTAGTNEITSLVQLFGYAVIYCIVIMFGVGMISSFVRSHSDEPVED